jgi:hypothetical protein
VLKLAAVRLLDDRDAPTVLSSLAHNPVVACMVACRVEAVGMDPWRLGGELWGYEGRAGRAERSAHGQLDGLCFSGANLVPLCGGPAALRAFTDRARRRGRVCSSVVGPAESVLPMWEQLAPAWGPAREIRPDQPLLALSDPPQVTPDPLVRPVRPEELERYLPAAIAMFTEEVGIDPRLGDGGAGYRARVAELVAAGRAFARFEGDQVVFKAEIGALSNRVGQVQGVWVHPSRRGCGLGTAGTAAVADRLVRGMGRTASLYVNSFNSAARLAYQRVGFRQVGTFATVLF